VPGGKALVTTPRTLTMECMDSNFNLNIHMRLHHMVITTIIITNTTVMTTIRHITTWDTLEHITRLISTVNNNTIKAIP
jgi:hypothetical protein